MIRFFGSTRSAEVQQGAEAILAGAEATLSEGERDQLGS